MKRISTLLKVSIILSSMFFVGQGAGQAEDINMDLFPLVDKALLDQLKVEVKSQRIMKQLQKKGPNLKPSQIKASAQHVQRNFERMVLLGKLKHFQERLEAVSQEARDVFYQELATGRKSLEKAFIELEVMHMQAVLDQANESQNWDGVLKGFVPGTPPRDTRTKRLRGQRTGRRAVQQTLPHENSVEEHVVTPQAPVKTRLDQKKESRIKRKSRRISAMSEEKAKALNKKRVNRKSLRRKRITSKNEYGISPKE